MARELVPASFLLDQDVQRAVARVLRERNFTVETAHTLGLGEADDDDLTVWADEHGAIVVTHDREFSRRRIRRPIGRHLELRCKERVAAALLRQSLDDVLELLFSADDVTVVLSANGQVAHHSRG